MPIRIEARAGAVAASRVGTAPVLPSTLSGPGKIDAKAGRGAEQDHLRRAAFAPQPERKTRPHEHHGREKGGQGIEGIEIELVFRRRKARCLGGADVAGQIPEDSASGAVELSTICSRVNVVGRL